MDEETRVTGSRKERKQRSDLPPPKKKKRVWKIFKIFLFLSLAIVIVGGGAAAGYIATLVKRAPALSINAITDMDATTKVYDSDKQKMFDLQGDGNRELIKSLDQVSPFVVNAFIAAEDKNFRSHFGINPLAMMRAAIQNVMGHGIVSGASTITQQTIKNAMFPEQDRTLERKVQEAYLAIQLEKKLTKDEIMVDYLNWIYFGKSGPNNLYGIERASESIFGVKAKDLNLAQATILASLPNNPTMYNPYQHLEATQERQEYILSEMKKAGYITDAQYQEAKKYDVTKALKDQQEKANITAGDFAHLNPEIETRAAEKLLATGKYDTLDDARQALFRGGFSIYTTINRKMQTTVDKTINDPGFYLPNVSYQITANDGKVIKVDNAMEQAGATLIDNKTGRILAMGGGRNYEKDQVNHATQPRQPGSTMKPLAVYGPALDLKQIGSGTVIDDVPMVWSDDSAANGKYFPFNWDNKFHGLMTVRTALEQSYNIPALKVFHDITPKVGLGYVKKMGVTTIQDNDYNLAAAIGGLSQGLTVEEATSAYTTFPNAGQWRDAYMIDEIKDRDGNTIYKHQSKTEQVFNPNADYILNDMLKGVVRRGTAAQDVGSKFPGYEIAGKTGTTNADKDAWFIGYTPDVTLGIWVGYNIPYTLPNGQGHTPQRLWSAIMNDVLPIVPNRTKEFFSNPGGVRSVAVCKYSGLLPSDLCSKTGSVITELYQSGAEPHQVDDVLVKAKYYVVGGKKYLANDSTPAYLVKEGVFFKRQPYELPDGNKNYLPLDSDMELPSDKGPYGNGDIPLNKNTPSGLKAAATSSSVTLSWNGVDGAKSYIVMRGNSEAGPFTALEEVQAPTFTDTTVQAGKTYAYQVVSTNADGIQSSPSNTVTATPGEQTALNAPTGVNVTPSAVGVSVTWQPVPGATAYNVYRNSEAGGVFQKLSTETDTSYADVGAVPGTTYYYKITAVANDQESPPSSAVGTPDSGGSNESVSPPSDVSVNNPRTGNSLTVMWSPVKEANGYVVERSTDGANWTQVGTVPGTSFNDGGLKANTTYKYRVRAISADGTPSNPSRIVSGTPSR